MRVGVLLFRFAVQTESFWPLCVACGRCTRLRLLALARRPLQLVTSAGSLQRLVGCLLAPLHVLALRLGDGMAMAQVAIITESFRDVPCTSKRLVRLPLLAPRHTNSAIRYYCLNGGCCLDCRPTRKHDTSNPPSGLHPIPRPNGSMPCQSLTLSQDSREPPRTTDYDDQRHA